MHKEDNNMRNPVKMTKTTKAIKAAKETCRLLAKDVWVSNDSFKTGKNNHDMVVGASCCGKTEGYVKPNIKCAESSMVVVDTKGLLFKISAPKLKKKGFEVVNIDFVNPERSAVYNMLDYVRTVYNKDGKTTYRQKDLRTIANVLVPKEMEKDDTFWVDSARNVVISLMAYVMEVMEESERNMITVAKLFLLISSHLKEIERRGEINFFEALRAEDPESFTVAMYDSFRGVIASEKTWGCIKQFVANALDPFIYDDLKDMFNGKSTLDFAELGRKKIILFVNISDTDRSMYPVVNVFYQQLFQALCNEADSKEYGRLLVPVRIIMDDFAANFNIPDFDKIISVIRSRQIFVSIILQSISQLECMYSGASAKTIINNCDYKVFYGGQDPDTVKYICDTANCIPEKITKMKADDVCILVRGEEIKFAKKIDPYSMDYEKEV